jgi:hypothetical protein
LSITAIRSIPEAADGLGAPPALGSANAAAIKLGLSISGNDAPANENFDLEPVLSSLAGSRIANDQASDRGRQPASLNASEIDRALLEPRASDLDPLLGKLAATARSAPAVIAPARALNEVTRPIGAPRLAPEAAEEEDSVLQELDKLIARLDAEAAQARAVMTAAPPLLGTKTHR